MTELERHLLKALQRLERQFGEQHEASKQAQDALQGMFERTSAEYGDLLKKVGNLSNQVNDLSDQLQKFGRLYGTGRR